MSNERKIKTTGDFREYIAEIVMKVESGQIETSRASSIHKMLHLINDNFFAEAKVAALQVQLQRDVKSFGSMPLSQEQERILAKAA